MKEEQIVYNVATICNIVFFDGDVVVRSEEAEVVVCRQKMRGSKCEGGVRQRESVV